MSTDEYKQKPKEGPSLEERQVRALEKIADQLETLAEWANYNWHLSGAS